MGETHYIVDILILLSGAVLAVPLFQRLGLGAVLGFLVAGTLVGPWGFGFIIAVEEIRHLAEFGVVFLLFVIGIELKPSRLWIMRHSVFGLGTAQVVVSGTLIMLLALALGFELRTALFVGFGLALSSTAFGLQILSDSGELGSVYGRTAFSILLLQDLAIVPMMALIPLLASQELTVTQDVELAATESLLIIIGVFLLGRLLLRPLLQLVAGSRRNPEIFTATGILLVLGAAWLTDWAGLSMALGAFLGGLLLADSRYRHQIMADIQPFRGLLLGLFFMSVGMSINFGLLASQGLLVVALVVGLLLAKAGVIWILCRFTGRSAGDSAQVALLLSQGGEFGFILFGLANVAGVVDAQLFQLLLLIIALSMAATPLLVRLSPWLIKPSITKPARRIPDEKRIPQSSNHVIIAGFGRFGRQLANNLKRARVHYLAIEIDPTKVASAQTLDYPVYFGDASQIEVLRSAGADRASLVVFAMDQMEPVGQAVVTAREAFPELQIYARAWDNRMARKLLLNGATYAIAETRESCQQLTRDVLQATGLEAAAVTRLLDADRQHTDVHRLQKQQREEGAHGYKNILLVVTEASTTAETLAYAAALASTQHARLTVAELLAEPTSGDESGITSPDELEERMSGRSIARLESMVEPLRETLEIQTKALIGSAHEQITQEVVVHDVDLVLKPVASQQSGRLQRLLGNEDIRLLKQCPVPLLLIRNPPPMPHLHRKICAGIYLDETPGGHRNDRLPINRTILESAAWLATAQFAELHIVHAWEAYGEQELRSGFSPFQFEAENYVELEQKRNSEAVDQMLAELRGSLASDLLPMFNPICHIQKGDHVEEIVRMAADLEADLVVVGNTPRTGLAEMIMENTSSTIVKQLDCSVLVVKTQDL
ncbi:MAG: monovalent cation:proton antiporter-2 (CPA2) family protein [Gammaproteobacteria bacterium]|nr:monovalent cation:proton antiporter-2 (CPA2) family protein [Gammaproteobacteria bacterium]